MKNLALTETSQINNYLITISGLGQHEVKEINVFKALEVLQAKLKPVKSESCKELIIVLSAFVRKQNTLIDITSLFA